MIKKIGLGTWSWGNQLFWNYKPLYDDDLLAAFQEAIKRGYSLIDTADSYGTGKFSGCSEKLIGKFLTQVSESQKKGIQIATKLAPYPWRVGRNGFDQPYMQSLERLNNNLDIVQLHWSTSRYNPSQEEQLLNNLCDLNEKGFKFKIGLSNIGPNGLIKLINLLQKRGKKIHCVQVQFSLLAPDLDKQEQVKIICYENKINFLAYSPLSFGLLCKAPIKSKSNNGRSLLRNIIFNIYEKTSLELRKALFEIANKRSVSQAQVAVNWCCYHGAIPIVGCRNREQIIDISRVLGWNLSNDEFQMLDDMAKRNTRKLPSNPLSSN